MMNDTSGTPGVTIHVAGSCLFNPGGHSGWAAVIHHGDGINAKAICRLSGGLSAAEGMTNIRAEMVAIVEALNALHGDGLSVTIWSNSSHVPKVMNQGFKRGKNIDLWQAIDAQAARHRIEWNTAPAIGKDSTTLEVKDMARKEAVKIARRERRIVDNVGSRK